MTSIRTNASAIAALQTLRSLTSALGTEQRMVSSGLRVGSATDNAAYWSISTTMRSDNMAVSAVSDALGLGAAKVDVAYAGLGAVIDILSEMKARLVAAEEDGVDKAKIQSELDQLKEQVRNIATSSSFSGVNWLNTEIADIYDKTLNRAGVVSSFVRGAEGVGVKKMDVDLSQIALFNSTGGGLLQADPRDLGTIGGLRFPFSPDGTMSNYSVGNKGGYRPSDVRFMFNGPLAFGVGDEISFYVTIDADNPADPISPPYHPGDTSHIVINRATVDAVLPSANGVISTYKEYAAVLTRALSGSGATAAIYREYDPPWSKNIVDVPDQIGISYIGNSSLDGSSLQITGFTSTVGSGGLSNSAIQYGERRSSMTLNFEPFRVYEEVVVNFDFSVGRESSVSYSFDKDYVNSLLGVDDGLIATSDDMATLLNSLIARPDIIIEATSGNAISVRTDPSIDRKSGQKSGVGFWEISVNIEPIPKLNFLEIDIEQNPTMVSTYITYIETVTGRITDAAATLGAIGKRIDLQSEFTTRLMDTISKGVGRLVDADMNEASTRLKALQSQEQLAIQALQIANSEPQDILRLFQ
ncbi:flagellin/flagellar hook associated protein [Sinorhizobium meliloti]|nr:flagellin/flagellar hook associated protein [Sinorhizobium meliloti]